jgi:hypothetical protein
VIDCGSFLVEGDPKGRSKGSRGSLPNTRIAGVKPVVLRVDSVSEDEAGQSCVPIPLVRCDGFS